MRGACQSPAALFLRTTQVMNKLLRSRICHLLSILKIHKPDCEHCKAKLTCGIVIRRRLHELDGQDERSGDSKDAGRALQKAQAESARPSASLPSSPAS